MLLRDFGAYEQGGCFAVLLMGAASPLLDKAVLYFKRKGSRIYEKSQPAAKPNP